MNLRQIILVIALCVYSVQIRSGPAMLADTSDQTRLDSLSTAFKQEYELEHYYQALVIMHQILDFFEDKNDIDQYINEYEGIFTILGVLKNEDLFKKHLSRAAAQGKLTENPLSKTKIDFYFAKYYFTFKDYKKAISSLSQCLLRFKDIEDSYYKGIVYILLGDTYMQMKQFGLALHNYKLAMPFVEKFSKQDETGIVYTRYAHVHQVLQHNEKNLEYNKAALKVRLKFSNKSLQASAYLNVGQAYWLLGDNETARHYLDKALQLAIESRATFYIEVIHRAITKLLISINQEEEAFYYSRLGHEYKARYNLAKSNSDILILETNRSLMAADDHIEKLAQELTLQKLQVKHINNRTVGMELLLLASLSLVFLTEQQLRKIRTKKKDASDLNKNLTKEIAGNEAASSHLIHSQKRYQFLAENSSDVIFLLNSDLVRTFVSKSCEKLFGYSVSEISGMNPIDFIDPRHQTVFTQHLLECLKSMQPISCTFLAIKKEQSQFWAEATFNPVLSPDQKSVLEIILVIRDYSEQKKNETEIYENARHKELLLKELHSRVKNNFAILSSLVSMINIDQNNANYLESMKGLQLRIRTMSLVHEQLFKSQEIDSVPLHLYLQTLSSIIVSSFNSGHIKLTTDLQPCLLSVDATLPVGLIVNELVLNAFKYAFPGRQDGSIHISLLDIGRGNFQLVVKDNGIGLPIDFLSNISNSMGSQIINLLVQQIEGMISISSDNGACFTVTFPVTTQNVTNPTVN